ncbi:MAG: kynureninase [Ferruginibacter sp.]
MDTKVGLDLKYRNTLDYAKYLDENDPLRSFREKFYIPLVSGKECVYLTGNSLGLQPKHTQEYVLNELEDWANYGVEGHFHARNPWVSYHELFPELLAPIVGGLPEEIVAMNQLTVNLHLLMISFYRPTKKRFKIICEAKAFPSDQYAIRSQVEMHGFDPDKTIIEIEPRPGENNIRPKDILKTIKKHGKKTALVLFGGVNYYSGQVVDMESICKAAHEQGAYCGIDLAHAAGNIELNMHDWDIDFACWCSYKYLNSGPGGVAGAFIHQRHITNKKMTRLAGWWGHDKESRFKMGRDFDPIPTAEGWQLSNAPVLSMSAHKASLDVFREAGMQNLYKKGKALSGYLLYILDELNKQGADKVIEVITPRNEAERGCQVSMFMLKNGKQIFDALIKAGVIADWREPNVIRVAPVPLYNSFEDIYKFGEIISTMIK